LFATFQARAEAVSAEVHRFVTRLEALAFLLDFLRAESVADAPGSYAVWADGPFLTGLDRTDLARQVPGLRFDVTRETSAAAKIGIGQVDFAIADTGTLVADSTAVEERLVSTLPAIHIALLPAGEIYPDLAAAIALLNPRRSPYLSMITGPSRTADIERVLTIGVHGPKRLAIVCIDELEGRR
jgi:L-lactate dehydrogenase complex protein LldG